MTATGREVLLFPILAVTRHRELVRQLTWRDVIGRYKGSFLGIAWSFLNPLLMLSVYSFVFNVVFKARWSATSTEGPIDFALVLFVGLIVHGFVADCITKSPAVIVSNPSFVKKVVFPLEMLPLVTVASAFFHLGVSFAVLVLGLLVTGRPLHGTVAVFPMIVFPLAVAVLGVCWVLASLGVYLRDIAQTVGIMSSVLLFLSPVFYPPTALPERFRFVVDLNPLTFVIEQSRNVIIWGKWPDWLGLFTYSVVAMLVAASGLWLFQRMRRGFADVI